MTVRNLYPHDIRGLEGYVNGLLDELSSYMQERVNLVGSTSLTVADKGKHFEVTASAPLTIFLPSANSTDVLHFSFRRTPASTANVVIQCTGGDTILGGTSFTLTENREHISIYNVGSAWAISARFLPSMEALNASQVVQLAGTQTITGAKTFSSLLTSTGGINCVRTGASSGQHSVAAIQNATTGDNISALNASSVNTKFSSAQITGVEEGHGTLKISHVKPSVGNDVNASALSIDLKGVGTEAKGIYINATDGGTTGNLLDIRNNDIQHMRLLADGSLSLAKDFSAPNGVLSVKLANDTDVGIAVQANSNSGANIFAARRSDGSVRVSISSQGALTARDNTRVEGILKAVNSTEAITIDTPAGTAGRIVFDSADSQRWHILKTNATESGSNAGSDFAINRYDDTGVFINTPFSISRSTGQITLASPLALTSGGTGSNTVIGAKQNLQIQGTRTISRTSVGSLTASDSGSEVSLDCSGGGFTTTLPDAASNQGAVFVFRKTDTTTNAATIAVAGSDTIAGLTSFIMNAPRETLVLRSNGSSTWVIESFVRQPVATNVTASGTTVTANTRTARLTTQSLTTAAGSTYTLTVSSATVTANSVVTATIIGGNNSAGVPIIQSAVPSVGQVVITIRNIDSTAALNGTLILGLVVQ